MVHQTANPLPNYVMVTSDELERHDSIDMGTVI